MIGAAEREAVYRVERCARLGYDRALHGDLAAFLLALLRERGVLHLLDFEKDGHAPGDRIDTTIAVHAPTDGIVEGSVRDLAEILRRDFPDRRYTSWLASRPPFNLDGTLLEAWDPASPWHPDRRPSIGVRFTTYSDLWFPWVRGLLLQEYPDDPPLDNRPLAERHTPRLNRFLAEARAATLDADGRWRIDEDFCDPFLLYAIREGGIDLAAAPARPRRPQLPRD